MVSIEIVDSSCDLIEVTTPLDIFIKISKGVAEEDDLY